MALVVVAADASRLVSVPMVLPDSRMYSGMDDDFPHGINRGGIYIEVLDEMMICRRCCVALEDCFPYVTQTRDKKIDSMKHCFQSCQV